VKEQHIYWIAKELNIYPDGVVHKKTKSVDMARTGKINRNNTEYVSDGKLNEKGIQAIESYLIQEGYKVKEEPLMVKSASIWEQADLISMMRAEYDKAVAERDEAKRDADQYCQMVDKCEKEIEELKDKLLIAEKENNSLKEEKKELCKMQLKTVDFDKEIDSLQKRIAQYNAEINAVSAEVNEFRKDVSVLITGVSQLQEKKKKLEGVMSDLVGCSKRLMNMK
jgi:chromosome segregation ATPase